MPLVSMNLAPRRLQTQRPATCCTERLQFRDVFVPVMRDGLNAAGRNALPSPMIKMVVFDLARHGCLHQARLPLALNPPVTRRKLLVD